MIYYRIVLLIVYINVLFYYLCIVDCSGDTERKTHWATTGLSIPSINIKSIYLSNLSIESMIISLLLNYLSNKINEYQPSEYDDKQMELYV